MPFKDLWRIFPIHTVGRGEKTSNEKDPYIDLENQLKGKSDNRTLDSYCKRMPYA